MTPYAISVCDVTPEDMRTLALADQFLASLPDRLPPGFSIVASTPDGVLSCHDVCAAWVAAGHPGVHVRGYWAGPFDHSWVVLPSRVILDLYPVAGVRPALFAPVPFGSPYHGERAAAPSPVYLLADKPRVEGELL